MKNERMPCLNTCPGVCEEIRRILKARKLTIKALAEKMGYDYQRLYRIIVGYSPLYFSDAVKIAQALDINIGELIRAAAMEDSE